MEAVKGAPRYQGPGGSCSGHGCLAGEVPAPQHLPLGFGAGGWAEGEEMQEAECSLAESPA